MTGSHEQGEGADDDGSKRAPEAVNPAGVEESDLFRVTFDRSPIGAVLFELDGTVVKVNEALREIMARPDPPLRFLADSQFPEDIADAIAAFRSLVAGDVEQLVREQRLRRADGEGRWVRITAAPIPRPDGRPALILAHVVDITLEREVAGELRRRAEHDPLTGLVSRDVLLGALAEAVDAAREEKQLLAVLYIDLDRFKQVNDRLGHDAGDRLLVHAAQEIVASVRPGDVASRMGGDEFVVLLQGIPSEHEARAVAERMREALATPVLMEGRVAASPGASIGVAVTHGFTTADALLRDADAALYRAKEHGRDRVEVFDAALRARAVQRLSTELLLRQSLEDGTLALRFEPVVDLHTGDTVGAKAVVALPGPDDELLPVTEVLSVAEETGLIHVLGAGAADRACQALADWSAVAGPGLWLTVDTTVSQLAHPGYVERLTRMLAARGADPASLGVSVPAAAVGTAGAHVRGAIDAVRQLGVRIVLEADGLDLRCLAEIDAQPVDAVVVDLAALPDVAANPVAAAVVGSAARVAATAGLEIIAAGLDRPAAIDAVRALGYRYGCGGALSPPIEAAALLAQPRGD